MSGIVSRIVDAFTSSLGGQSVSFRFHATRRDILLSHSSDAGYEPQEMDKDVFYFRFEGFIV